MAETATIVNLKDWRTTGGSSDSRENVRLKADIVNTRDASERAQRETKFEDLYSADTKSHALISRARELLHSAEQRAQKALELLSSSDEVGADQQIMLLQGDLPELFCCRDLSDGLATFVLALHYALYNQHGAPLNADQIFEVRRGLKHLRDNLFIDFKESLDLVDGLADRGLTPEAPETTVFSDVITNQSAEQGAD